MTHEHVRAITAVQGKKKQKTSSILESMNDSN